MRKLVSIFVFSAALFVGVFSLPVYTPTIYEKLYPAFSQDEVDSFVGKKVTNKTDAWRWRGMKFPLDIKGDSTAEFSQNGETGRVVDVQNEMTGKDIRLQKIMKNCGLLVKWDKKNKDGKDMYSCDGRFSSRVFLEFE
jgi:hypothetical protein